MAYVASLLSPLQAHFEALLSSVKLSPRIMNLSEHLSVAVCFWVPFIKLVKAILPFQEVKLSQVYECAETVAALRESRTSLLVCGDSFLSVKIDRWLCPYRQRTALRPH